MRGKSFIFVALSAIGLCACSKSEEYLEFKASENIGAELPFFEDFEDGEFAGAQNLYLAFEWQIADDGGNAVLKCAAVNEEEMVCGNSIYTLGVGDPSWEDYSLSFDFKLTEGAQIRFAPYMETNADMSEGSRMLKSPNPWILTITSEGELWYETMFDQGTCCIGVLDGFAADGWNNVRLTPEGTTLIMSFNGAEIGEVAELSEAPSGRIGIGGTVGFMIDNICAEH